MDHRNWKVGMTRNEISGTTGSSADTIRCHETVDQLNYEQFYNLSYLKLF